MAKGLTAAEQAAKWAANAQAAVDSYRKGVMKVTQSPTAKAAQNLGKAKINYAAAVDSGLMAAKLNAVSTADWQAAASGKGATNYPVGIQNAGSKMLKALNTWVPIRNAIAAQVQAMPNDTYAARKARAIAMMDGMHAAKQSKAGG
jgi:hypothetical protein